MGGLAMRAFAEGYRAATEGCGLVRRDDRFLLRVHGRAPRQMLHGMLTNGIPDPPAAGGGVLRGEAAYGAVLTPKGRMVTDLTTYWLGADEADGIGLAVSTVARLTTGAHLARFLPPRFARAEDLSGGAAGRDQRAEGVNDSAEGVDGVALMTVVGPGAADAVCAAVGVAPDTGYALVRGGPRRSDGVLVARGIEQAGPSWDVWAARGTWPGLASRLEAAGAQPTDPAVWDTLRIEAGFPRYGVDMDESTIPIEAGLEHRAFDHDKGCYTGQEVIVRIRHRGHVNWHLRALRFGNADATPGDKLFEPEGTKVRGRVTSVAESPRFGQKIGLGYVRREVEPPATLRLGDGDGPPVGVEAPADPDAR